MARQQLGTAPAAGLDTATKQYVDAAVAAASGSSGAALVVSQTNTLPANRAGYWIQMDASNNVQTIWVENNLATTNLVASVPLRRSSAVANYTSGGSTLALDTTTYHKGTSSIRATPNAVGAYPYVTATTYSDGAPVTAGSAYTGVMSVLCSSSQEQFSAVINWYTSSGTYLSNVVGTSTITPNATWTLCSVTATAPTNAAWATAQVQSTFPMDTSEYFNVDEYGVQAGANTVWQM